MNTPIYTEAELRVMHNHERKKIEKALSDYRAAKELSEERSATTSRWQSSRFCNEVKQARKTFGANLLTLCVLGLAFFFSSLIIQEVLADFQGLFESVYSEKDEGRTAATFILTATVMTVLLIVKQWSDTTKEKQMIKAKVHTALCRPYKNIIVVKHGVKAGLLTLLIAAYIVLYNYIAAGPGDEALKETTSELEAVVSSLGGNSQKLDIDEAADSQSVANSFAFYYLIEFLLHICLLYFVPKFKVFSPKQLLAWKQRDEAEAKTARLKLAHTHTIIRSMLKSAAPDDGHNDLRCKIKNGLATNELSALFPEEIVNKPNPQQSSPHAEPPHERHAPYFNWIGV